MMACAKVQFDGAQTDLNQVYDGLVKLHGDNEDLLERLKSTQSAWLAYRDAECVAQVDQVETQSLKPLTKLSCEGLLTQQRLSVLQGGKEKTVDEVEALPRWVNVLAADYADVFWRYGSHTQVDLNCDSQKEEIMSGVKLNPSGLPEVILAVVENPSSGRPRISDFTFAKRDDGICGSDLVFETLPMPVAQDDLGACPVSLHVHDKACDGSYALRLEGKMFSFVQDQAASE